MIGQINRAYIAARPSKFVTRMISRTLFEGRPLTAKGRWINPLVSSIHALGKRFPFGRKIDKPIFIFGMGRSGTTILGVTLSMHRECGFLNEPKALWNSVFPFDDVIGSYSRGKALYELDASHATPQARQEIHRIYGLYLACVSAKRLVDKYPELLYRVELLRALFPDFKGLFIYRNGWDACASSVAWSRKNAEKLDDGSCDWWGRNNRKWDLLVSQLLSKDEDLKAHAENLRTSATSADRSAVEWILSVKKGLRMAAQYPNKVLPVRYEDLSHDPKGTLESICRFCELERDPGMLRYAETTLKIVPAKAEASLNPDVHGVFMRLMKTLNYA